MTLLINQSGVPHVAGSNKARYDPRLPAATRGLHEPRQACCKHGSDRARGLGRDGSRGKAAGPHAQGPMMTALLEIIPLPVDGDGLVRRLSAGDVPAICRLFQGLDMASRCPRFAGARSDEAMTRHSDFLLD